MKREGIWLAVILVLAILSAYAVVKLPVKYGLDIKGGIRAVLQADVKPGMPYDQATVVRVLENRLNSTGVAEPVIQPKGLYQFNVELPDVKNKDAIIEQLKTTAQMEFRYFQDVRSKKNQFARYEIETTKDAQGHEQNSFIDEQQHKTFRDQAQVLTDFQGVLKESDPRTGATAYTIPAPLNFYAPQNQTLYFTPDQITKIQSLNEELSDYKSLIDDSPLILTGAEIKPGASAALSTAGGMPEPVVNVAMSDKGAKEFADFTSAHVNELLAIILDGRVLSAPNIEEPIMDGNTQISGGFANLDEAQSLANYLNAGALPVPLTIEEVQSVEATLGPTAVHRSIIAGLVGLALVLIFMAAYYLLPGLVADVALIFYALFALAIFKGGLGWFVPPVTLTLAGIAGFILSVGMAVDANILIFERLKEELRNGKPLKQAIDAGFRRAFTAIRDSNICTIITCVILFTMGTPSVQGFALTLGIGVVVSLFTAITVTRTLLYLLVDAGAGKRPDLFGLKRQWVTGNAAATTERQKSANIIGHRKYFYGLSLLIIIPGAIFLLIGGLKKGIEFTGGTQVEFSFKAPTTQGALSAAMTRAGYHDTLIQMAEQGSIAYVNIMDKDSQAYLGVEKALTGVGLPVAHDLVGPTISKELTEKAFEAVLVAASLIVLYLAFAFAVGGFVAGLRFGISAIIALLHDVLVLLGSFAIFGFFFNWQIDSMFVTATLTVVGFSVHDTIVIFDRLRENLRHARRDDAFEELANRSILQSFARSINTSFTVVLTLLAMMFLGEPSTRLLVVALLIGIISGTYSSIFNATPILVDWENWLARRQSSPQRFQRPPSRPPDNGGGRSEPPRGAPTDPSAWRTKASPLSEGSSEGADDGGEGASVGVKASKARMRKKAPRR